jgi:hypothetical protein
MAIRTKDRKKDSQLQVVCQLYERTRRRDASAEWFHASLPQLQNTLVDIA